MRIWIAAALLGTAPLATAERLLYIPTARKIPFGMFKYEFRAEPRVKGDVEHYLGVGLTPFWELELHSDKLRSNSPVGSFDLTYNYLAPITDLTPGFAFGIQDVLNDSMEGTRPFIAITFRQGFFAIGGEAPADLTLGLSMARKRLYPQVGASIPFSQEVRLLAEHDGLRLSVGAEVRPIKDLAFRFVVREQSSLLGLMYQRRF